jgi:hypothetical protein
MFKMVTKILGVIALTGWMGAANAALIFDFSWDSDNGKIIGEIYGLSDNGDNLEASGLVLTSVGGMQVSIDVFNDPFWAVLFNEFSVVERKIVHADFYANRRMGGDIVGRFSLSPESGAYYGDGPAEYYGGYEFLLVNRVTVPEPSSVILMLLGLAGLSFARYRKQY